MSFLTGLNDAQRQAVDHHNGPLLVVAGAGSGKTRALTHRIAHLIGHHGVDPAELLAVTFTNKAAKEMKERLEILLSQKLALSEVGMPFAALEPHDQRRLRSRIYKEIIRELWIGTFHALFARLLRFDIDKYKDSEGLGWTKQFTIYDEADAQSLVREVVTQELGLDPKRYEPKKVRWAISNAKNQGWSPDNLVEDIGGQRGKVLGEAYRRYRKALAANNALDFDDLLLMPVQLLEQNKQVREYWHRRFKHILVDEYQDTNRTQYQLIKLIATGGESPATFRDWSDRSVFVVGDADQSIYSFRAADFTILMGFQKDFGDGEEDSNTKTMVKLEENYRSTATILEAANALIAHNSERIDKVLRATRGKGEAISITRCDDEIAEAESVVHRMRVLKAGHAELKWADMAVLYRTNAQSRAIEESLVRWGIPYLIVGGLRFYDRREVRDILAYLKAVTNPSDSVSLLRIINTPKRGIGKTTIDRLNDTSSQLGVPLWEVVNDPEAVRSLAGRSARNILQFCELINGLRERLNTLRPSEMLRAIMDESGYIEELLASGTDESEERRRNLNELVNAGVQFEEENENVSVEEFLAASALASDGDSKDAESDRVILMTLHASKGLEFPVIFLVGLEQGLFPSYRALDDIAAMEEERRLCYVGITRAKERLFLSHALERRLWGGMREPAIPSMFLAELPDELVEGDKQRHSAASLRREERIDRLTRVDNTTVKSSLKPEHHGGRSMLHEWRIGDRVSHKDFGIGVVTHIFGYGEKSCLAAKFGEMSPRILDPRLAPIRPVE